MRSLAIVLVAALGAATPARAGSESPPAGTVVLERGSRLGHTHARRGMAAPISGPAVASLPNGAPLLAWFAREGDRNALWVLGPGDAGARPVRVDPPGIEVDSNHQPPALAVGPGSEVLVSWSSAKAKPEGTLFASDLRLSRSTDGGRSFGPPLRVNDDRPISHSFEGLAVAGDGSALLAWIDSRDGQEKAGTYLARVAADGARVEATERLGEDTCVCCRVDLASSGGRVAALWRKDFPGDVRDMVLALSSDGGRTFSAPALVHDDRWVMPGCPHRGGSAAIDARGRVFLLWYTEGRDGRPALLFASSPDGRTFAPPLRIDASDGSIPDHARLGVGSDGRLVAVWEEATAVRRRIVARASSDGGRSFGPLETVSSAMKAYDPDLAVSPSGEFLVAWNEEQFPVTRTVVQILRVGI